MSSLEIVTWNCHSLYANLSQFKIFLYTHKPHVVCLCETWLKDDRLPTFINYTPFFVSRCDRPGGGIAILTRNDLCILDGHLVALPGGFLEVQMLTICGCGYNIDLLNLYNPGRSVSEHEFDHYFQQMKSPCIIVGDFNAHHSLWRTKGRDSATGSNLVAALFNFPDICLLTPPDLQTYFHVPTRSYSTLDLCFLSSELFSIAHLSLLDDLGGDHTPILISLNFSPIMVAGKTKRRWVFGQEGSWNLWRAALPPVNKSDILECNYSSFSDHLLLASHEIFKMTSGSPVPKYSKIWWTAECALLVKDRHSKKNFFRRHPTADNLIQLRQAEARVKRAVRAAKVQSFRSFCSVINSTTPVSVIWKRIRQLNNKSPKRVSVPLVQGDAIYTAPPDKANLLASHYEALFNESTHLINSQSLLLLVTAALLDDSLCSFNMPITMSELHFVLWSSKNNTPGHDDIHNNMLKQLPDDYKEWALCIINQSFDFSELPESWKLAIINPILKPLKLATLKGNYRPISLLPCFSKLMGKIIQRRLNFILESSKSYSSSQGGFRKRLCTLDQVARVEQVIRYSLASQAYCIVIFVDLSSAYDSIYHLGLIYKLSQLGIKGAVPKSRTGRNSRNARNGLLH